MGAVRHFARLCLTTCLFLLSTASSLAAERQYNIFLVDQEQLGMGDLISNWTVALYLKSQHPEDRVVFYVSSAFHDKFRIIEPKFEIPKNDSADAIHEQTLHGVHLVTTKEGQDPDEDVNKQLVERFRNKAPSSDRVCNLAFTANRPDVFRTESSEKHHRGAVPLTMAMFEATKNQAIPFIVVKYMFDQALNRVDLIETAGAASMSNVGYPTAFFLNSNIYNKTLYVSKEPLKSVRGDLGVWGADYRSYVHADSIEAIGEYLELVEAMADELPKRKFSVVLTKMFDEFVKEKPSKSPAPMANLNGGNSSFTERKDFVEFVRGRHENLFIRQYDGIPFRDTLRLIRGSNLPIFVTGTMSLSSAMQYDKPFLYEVMDHHGRVSGLMAFGVTQDADHYLNMLIPNRKLKDGEQLTAKVFAINTANKTILSPPSSLEDIATVDRLSQFFGFDVDDGDVLFDEERFEDQYLRQTARLKQYRLHNGPWGHADLPKAHLIDDIPRLCKKAREIGVTIRDKCLSTSNATEKKQCVVKGLTEASL